MASRTPLAPAVKAARGTIERSRERRRTLDTRRARKAPRKAPAPPRRAYVAIATSYIAGVLDGRLVACKWLKLACQRQVRDLRRAEQDPRWPYQFDATIAASVCRFIERLPHVEGAWSTALIRLEPWQIFIVTTLFGWRRRDDGTGRRRFTEGYFEVGRKAAKTTIAAAMNLYHLVEEHEPGAQLKCAATTGQQARIVFGLMQRMIERSPWLQDRGLRVLANAVTYEPKGVPVGNAQPINAKASSQDGLNPSWVCLDEAHALPDHKLWNVLRSAQGGRVNPFTWLPTTAGYNLLGPAYEARTRLCKVLEGIFEADHYFGVIYTLDEGNDWRDERVWIKANPMLGITPKLDWMRQYAASAQASPGLEGEFRTKCCNQWLQSSLAWLSVAAWDACAETSLSLDDFKGEPCFIGGDLAQLDDIAALALLFLRGDILYVFCRFYLPRLVVEERAKAVPAYREWTHRNVLTLTEGAMIDYRVIEADIRAYCKRFQVRAIRMDQFGSAQLTSSLAEDNLPAALMDKNTNNFTPPAREFETRIKHQRLRHDGNPCLRWMVSNVVVRRGVDDTLLPKKESPNSANKIDGVDAVLEALSALLVMAPQKSKAARHPKLWTRDGWVSA